MKHPTSHQRQKIMTEFFVFFRWTVPLSTFVENVKCGNKCLIFTHVIIKIQLILTSVIHTVLCSSQPQITNIKKTVSSFEREQKIHTSSHDAFRVLAVEVELLVQYEALQPGREKLWAHDLGVVELPQGQTPPDLQSAEVTEGARTAWRARFRKTLYLIHSYCDTTLSSEVLNTASGKKWQIFLLNDKIRGCSVHYNHSSEVYS